MSQRLAIVTLVALLLTALPAAGQSGPVILRFDSRSRSIRDEVSP